MPTTTVPSKAAKEYYAAAKAVIDAAGDYAAAIKLKNNLLDRSTAWKVEDVFDEHFGSMKNLNDAIKCRKDFFEAKVEKFNVLARQNGVYQVTKPDALLNILLSERKRSSYKGKIKTRLKNDKIEPLQSFEKK